MTADLDSAYPLRAEDIAAYRRDGHVVLRGVCTRDEIGAYRGAIVDTVRRLNRESRPLAERDTYGKAFLQTTNLWEADATVRQFVMSRRFGRIAAELMGVDGVRLYHDQALFKEPGGGPTPWHQDQYYWPLDTHHTITMWMPLVDASAEMGTMTFAAGSQRDGYFGNLAISDESQAAFERMVAERGYPTHHCGAMAAGDASFHSGWILHGAPPNSTTDRTREAMTIIYFADGTRLLEPDNDGRRADLARWHPGQRPGEFASSPLNPVVYARTEVN